MLILNFPSLFCRKFSIIFKKKKVGKEKRKWEEKFSVSRFSFPTEFLQTFNFKYELIFRWFFVGNFRRIADENVHISYFVGISSEGLGIEVLSLICRNCEGKYRQTFFVGNFLSVKLNILVVKK